MPFISVTLLFTISFWTIIFARIITRLIPEDLREMKYLYLIPSHADTNVITVECPNNRVVKFDIMNTMSHELKTK